MSKRRIAIFASGGGSNAQAIIDRFENHLSIQVVLIITNRSDAGVIKRAQKAQIPHRVITKKQLADEDKIDLLFMAFGVDFIVLAGFLLLIPAYLCRMFPNRMVNIHPALLPKYGGKGMYGQHVHKAVKAAGDTESGITIHFVNEEYDEGAVIFQAKREILPGDSAEDIATKVLELEHEHYPQIIESCVLAFPIDEEQ